MNDSALNPWSTARRFDPGGEQHRGHPLLSGHSQGRDILVSFMEYDIKNDNPDPTFETIKVRIRLF